MPYRSLLAPGATSATDSKVRAAEPFAPGADSGTRFSMSALMVVLVLLEPTSTVGRTVRTTSSAAPVEAAMAALTRKVVSDRTAMPPCWLGKNPSLSKLIEYMPGGSCAIR